MEVITIIIGTILILLIVILVFACIACAIHWYTWFYWRPCKHCGHTLEYKGLKDDNDNGHYLFHCPKCGAWEQIPKEEFIRKVNKDFYESNRNSLL